MEIPPEKKPRLNKEDGGVDCKTCSGEEAGASSPISDCYDYDSDDSYRPDCPIWAKYLQQIEESEGFDVTDFPGTSMLITIYGMPTYRDNLELRGYVEMAINKYNLEKGTHWEVEKILNVNGEGCRSFTFYVTLSVKTHEGDKDIFQAKVVRNYLDDQLDFPIVRPKARKDSDIMI